MASGIGYKLLLVGAVVLSALRADFHYFTYWSFQNFTFYLLLSALELRRPQVAWFCLFNAVLVMVGVFTMSILRSPDGTDMLTETAESAGLLAYTVGTYAIHYLPVAVVGSTAPLPTNDDREGLEAALLNAISLFVLYISFNDPSQVYGVPITPAIAFSTAIGFTAVVLLGLWLAGFH